MAYKLRVMFSGVLGFVVHPEKRGACVLLADGRVGSMKAPGQVWNADDNDDQESTVDAPHRLDRHFGFMRIPGVHLGQDGASELVRYLDRERVRFKVENPRTSSRGWNFGNLLSLPGLVPNANVNSAALKAKPPKSVLAQVVLEGGDFKTTGSGGTWTIKNPLNGAPPSRPLAYEAEWSISVPRGAPKVVLESMDGGRAKSIPLKPVGGEVTVHVSNVCHENPLRWTHYKEVLRDDVDFRWHYELLSRAAKKALSKELQGAMAPHPSPVKNKSILIGGGMNCVFTRYSDSAYEL